MSGDGIYTALSGAMAQSQRLDTIANNIANAQTTAFKKDGQIFSEQLAAEKASLNSRARLQRDLASVPYEKEKGRDKSFVLTERSFTDYSQGSLSATGNSLDIAIEGPGFFEVLSPQGVLWTRSGALKVDGRGRLVTQQGYPVLKRPSTQTESVSERFFQLPLKGGVNVSKEGRIYSGRELLGELALMESGRPQALRKLGHSLYEVRSQQDAHWEVARSSRVHQGFLERSNVNIVDEMTSMISATRVFESTQKVIRAFDAMNGKLVNTMGGGN